MTETVPAAEPTRAKEIESEPHPVKRVGKILGPGLISPGLITGAADDDPSGIGTYAVAGASLGLAMFWTALITFPFMAAVQNISARVGIATEMDLAGVIVRHYPRWVVVPTVLALAAANTVNAGADLGAMADAVGVVAGVRAVWLVIPIGAAIVALQLFADYRQITRTFKWLTLALFAYVVNALLLRPDIGTSGTRDSICPVRSSRTRRTSRARRTCQSARTDGTSRTRRPRDSTSPVRSSRPAGPAVPGAPAAPGAPGLPGSKRLLSQEAMAPRAGSDYQRRCTETLRWRSGGCRSGCCSSHR